MRAEPVSDAELDRAAGVGESRWSQAARASLFELMRILLQYLERVDQATLRLAKEVSVFLRGRDIFSVGNDDSNSSFPHAVRENRR